MRIRQKLIVSFSSLLITALLLLGTIFYSSFSQDIEAKRRAIDAIKCNSVSSFVDRTLQEELNSIAMFSIRYNVGSLYSGQSDSAHNVLFYSKSSEYVIRSKTTSAITLVSKEGKELLHLGSGSAGIDYTQLTSTPILNTDGSKATTYLEENFSRLAYPHFDPLGELAGLLFFTSLKPICINN